MNPGFKDLAAGAFESGLARLDADSEWHDDQLDLAGPFRLGFPGAQGFGEELLVASLLKRHAHASRAPVEVAASEQSCHILRHDPAFRLRAQDDNRTTRSPLAILRQALTGELLDEPFVPLASQLKVVPSQGDRRPRVGIAWASVQGEKCIPRKCVPVESFLGALDKIDADLVSLQRHLRTTDPKGLAAKRVVQQIEDEVLEASTSATSEALVEIIQGLDFLVAISTTTTHIAAAMGKRVELIVAERQGPQWFWQVQAIHGKCLYPTVRVHMGDEKKQVDWWQGSLDSVQAAIAPFHGLASVDLRRGTSDLLAGGASLDRSSQH